MIDNVKDIAFEAPDTITLKYNLKVKLLTGESYTYKWYGDVPSEALTEEERMKETV